MQHEILILVLPPKTERLTAKVKQRGTCHTILAKQKDFVQISQKQLAASAATPPKPGFLEA
ncbi:MAG: hypothetical protein LAT75_06460 [Candidatus Cyclonatronum sp.]|uniref:hypothetical protein n=1 Tax=Cyclonatronum sp. TaxID=3024185 RepID=UPI0025C21C85|nr:hypothetical protein [Cyclonatronum sp.]MCC5934680.1 hypothetical protein [Balneolales bacterium]MCH8486489.1 hypothetical protein [Cyclonatronum sp.]